MTHVIDCIWRRKFYIQSQSLCKQINLLWSWLVLIKNPESAMSETETRLSPNTFDADTRPSKGCLETDLKYYMN